MVRSPARRASSIGNNSSSSSRQQRIESSSEELEEQPILSPRKSRLSRVVSLPNSSSPGTSEDASGDAEGESDDDGVAEAGQTSAPTIETPAAAANDNDEEEEEAEEQEELNEQEQEEEDRIRIWEMFADEYHDIVEQLPLELQRSFQLMLEHDEQMRAHEKALENATIEYFSLAKSDAYADAMIKAQLARKMAAHLGEPPLALQVQPAIVRPINGDSTAPAVSTQADDTPVSHTAGNDDLPSNGGGNCAASAPLEDASMSSDEAVQTELLRPISPVKQTSEIVPQENSAAVEEDGESAEHLRRLLGDIVTHSRAAIKAGEDKVALAKTAYDWVDRHIHRLDSDALKHEEALSLGLRAGTMPSGDAQGAYAHAEDNNNLSQLQNGHGLPGGGKGAMPYDGRNGYGKSKASGSRKKDNKRKSKEPSVAFEEPYVASTSSEADTTPYCYCNTPSFGIMVGCDNDDCARQWFHLGCLNLSAPPEVSPWYCNECAASVLPKKKKKPKRSRR